MALDTSADIWQNRNDDIRDDFWSTRVYSSVIFSLDKRGPELYRGAIRQEPDRPDRKQGRKAARTEATPGLPTLFLCPRRAGSEDIQGEL